MESKSDLTCHLSLTWIYQRINSFTVDVIIINWVLIESLLNTIVANIKSAIKRVNVAERNRLRNKSYRSAIRTLTKRFLDAAEQYAAAPTSAQMNVVQECLSAAYSKIDKAIKCGVIHRNTGARKKARLARILSQQTEASA